MTASRGGMGSNLKFLFMSLTFERSLHTGPENPSLEDDLPSGKDKYFEIDLVNKMIPTQSFYQMSQWQLVGMQHTNCPVHFPPHKFLYPE